MMRLVESEAGPEASSSMDHRPQRPHRRDGRRTTAGLAAEIGHNLREELWSYLALIGLLCLHAGIVLSILSYKEALSPPSPRLLAYLGPGTAALGGLGLLLSGAVYTRHKRRAHAARQFCSKSSLKSASADGRGPPKKAARPGPPGSSRGAPIAKSVVRAADKQPTVQTSICSPKSRNLSYNKAVKSSEGNGLTPVISPV